VIAAVNVTTASVIGRASVESEPLAEVRVQPEVCCTPSRKT
jgi:hypothetical protein